VRLLALLFVVCLILAMTACDESGTPSPVAPTSSRVSLFDTGFISVFVHWDEGLAGKRVAVLELGREGVTNEDGIVNFRVPAGGYTVRVYEINRGGPAVLYVDTKVTVGAHERTTVDVIDCLPCV
jgi:hypothetical protein